MFAYITANPDFLLASKAGRPAAFTLVFAANALGIFTANFINSRLAQLGAATLAGEWASLAGLLAALVMNVALLGAAPAMAGGGALAVAVSVTRLIGRQLRGAVDAALCPQAAAAATGLAPSLVYMLASASGERTRQRR